MFFLLLSYHFVNGNLMESKNTGVQFGMVNEKNSLRTKLQLKGILLELNNGARIW